MSRLVAPSPRAAHQGRRTSAETSTPRIPLKSLGEGELSHNGLTERAYAVERFEVRVEGDRIPVSDVTVHLEARRTADRSAACATFVSITVAPVSFFVAGAGERP